MKSLAIEREFGSGGREIGMHNVQEAAAFYGSRVTTLLLDMFCMFLMVTLMGWNDKVAKLIVQVLVTVANYILSKFLVFRKK